MTQEEYKKYLDEYPCKENCPYHNGSDCTRNPYEEGCIDPVIREHWDEKRLKE